MHKYDGVPDYISGHNPVIMTKKRSENISNYMKNIWKSRSEKEKNKIFEMINTNRYKKPFIKCLICGTLTKNEKYCSKKCYGLWMKDKSYEEIYGKKTAKRLIYFHQKRQKESMKSIKGKTLYEIYGEKRAEAIKSKIRKDRTKSKVSEYKNHSEILKERIKKRDNYTCQNCGDFNNRIDTHHIDYNKKNYDESNIIALCIGCHTMIHKTKDMQDYWKERLMNIQKKRGLIA